MFKRNCLIIALTCFFIAGLLWLQGCASVASYGHVLKVNEAINTSNSWFFELPSQNIDEVISKTRTIEFVYFTSHKARCTELARRGRKCGSWDGAAYSRLNPKEVWVWMKKLPNGKYIADPWGVQHEIGTLIPELFGDVDRWVYDSFYR